MRVIGSRVSFLKLSLSSHLHVDGFSHVSCFFWLALLSSLQEMVGIAQLLSDAMTICYSVFYCHWSYGRIGCDQ